MPLHISTTIRPVTRLRSFHLRIYFSPTGFATRSSVMNAPRDFCADIGNYLQSIASALQL